MKSDSGTMKRIYIITDSANDWAKFLADPVKHWRPGFSARTLAHSWEDAMGFPAEVQRILARQFPGQLFMPRDIR